MKKQSLLKAFSHAFNGLFYFLAHDRNGKLHLIACLLVSFLGIYFKVSANEWSILLLCFALVISLEMCNHALENLCNLVHPDHHPLVKTVKDVAAAAVLWSAIISAAIGMVIFIPKIMALI